MRIGVLKETKDREQRVALLPDGARMLAQDGHEVWVETLAGEGSGFPDEAYEDAGARIAEGASELLAGCDLVTKVKEPTPAEVSAMRPGQGLFCFLHLAADAKLAERLCEREVVAIAYEHVEEESGALPLLTPMSIIAGRLATQIGAHLLQSDQGGRGILLGGVPGVARGRVVVLGGGVVGRAAVRMAVGLEADVRVLDIHAPTLADLAAAWGPRIQTIFSTPMAIEREVRDADLCVGAVLVRGQRAPRLVTAAMVREMRPGSVIIDVAVDEGGCVETIRATSHSEPTYRVHGVLHYGVPNIPGAVPHTSTQALCNATFPYLRALAGGVDEALRADPVLARGVNSYAGEISHAALAHGLGMRAVAAPWA